MASNTREASAVINPTKTSRTPRPQVLVAATDARPDLSLPAGKHEALVYVW
jgi:hypothetical protein